MVVVGPPVAWLLWVSWSEDKASDAVHVAWFATVAASWIVAGALVGRRSTRVRIAAVAVVSALATLFGWWSSQDESGLFVVGLIIATPFLLLMSLPLLWIGNAWSLHVRSRSKGRPAP
ncbi:hypothetical protein GCM10009641_82990 [Mycobacterium cookii]|uniref:Uncharacterized protein n=1 Tax=Nocardioides furvisabuli TaxID=375542 RepID=A0ABP5J0L8_9ACTN|nr:hypothetical protein [Nocardioides furvisabuli]